MKHPLSFYSYATDYNLACDSEQNFENSDKNSPTPISGRAASEPWDLYTVFYDVTELLTLWRCLGVAAER